jgi:hypothetical protein
MIFFIFRVAGQADDLHAVLQRQGNFGQRVGGRDKQDVRQVVVDIQVVIVESVVLFGIEDLKQRRRRVAPEVHAHFVYFVQTEYRVVDANLFEGLDDLSRHGADIRASVTTDLGLVPNTAQ